MSSRLWLWLTIAMVWASASISHAASVTAVKDNQIIIDMEGDSFKVNDILKIQDGSGKTVGLAKVKIVKGKKAKCIIKGHAETGDKLVFRSPGDASKGRSRGSSSGSKWGFMVGMDMASAKATLASNSQSVSMSGTGFLAKGLIDMGLFSWLDFRGLAGITSFDVSGSQNAGCGTSGGACNTNIMYLDGDFLGRFKFTPSVWAGVGVDLLFPLSKTATAIAPSSISNTLVYDLAFGYDWGLSGGNYIPIQVDYAIFPSSATVSASMITFSAGYTFK